MFSDECIIKQFKDNRPFVRRPTNNRFCNRYVTPTVRSSPSVMIWGAITARGRGGLYLVPPGVTVKKDNYLEIIRDKVPRFTVRGINVFQHDGAPANNAIVVRNSLRDALFETLAG